YKINIIFTTHSLALIKTLDSKELYYLDQSKGKVINVSYNYIKSLLFGFSGYDKYILTEDRLLKTYIDYLIAEIEGIEFSKHIVIYIGGATNTVDLMRRSDKENFFSSQENVLTILDGDQQDKSYCKNNNRVL